MGSSDEIEDVDAHTSVDMAANSGGEFLPLLDEPDG